MIEQKERRADPFNAGNDAAPRFTLAAYLSAGVGLAGLAPAADAAIVTIDITNPAISGPNAGIAQGGDLVVNNWVLGSTLRLFNGLNTFYGLGGTNIAFGVSNAYQNQYASPQNVAAGTSIDAYSYFSFTGNDEQSVLKVEVSYY